MIVQIAVAHVASIQQQRVIQQRAVAIRNRRQLVQIIRKHRDVIILNARQRLNLLRVVLMMRGGVVRIGRVHLRVGSLAEFARHHEGGYARDVGLERSACKSNISLTCSSYDSGMPTGADGTLGLLAACFLRALNPPLDLANVVEIIPPRACDRPSPARLRDD